MTQTGSKQSAAIRLQPPTIETKGNLIIAGFRERYPGGNMDGVLTQWQRFAPHIGKMPGETSLCAYGLCFNTSDSARNFEYMTGVEVSGADGVPSEFTIVTIPAQRYAVFLHHGHISQLRATFDAVWNKGLAESGYKMVKAAAGAPDFFEFYTNAFDPATLSGTVEIWIPIES